MSKWRHKTFAYFAKRIEGITKNIFKLRIFDKAAIIFYINRKIFISFESRACSQHFTESKYQKIDEFDNVTRNKTKLRSRD